jgi:predicted ATP-grasp superfamily ATP-dependent carboligase
VTPPGAGSQHPTDEQMCEAVVDGLAAEPYVSSAECVSYYEELEYFTPEAFERVAQYLVKRERDLADRRRRQLEQQLAEKQALIASLEVKIAALQEQIMCEEVVESLAEHAQDTNTMTSSALSGFYDKDLLKRLLPALTAMHFPPKNA